MPEERKVARRHWFTRLLLEYERNLRTRVQRGEIREVTLDTYMNNANRVLEALVFSTERTDIEKAMRSYEYGGCYKKIIRDLKQIVEQRAPFGVKGQ